MVRKDIFLLCENFNKLTTGRWRMALWDKDVAKQ